MKVLIVSRYKERKTHNMSPFVYEQGRALEKSGINVMFFLIKGHGILAYVKSVSLFKQVVSDFNPDVIHAHYGFAGLFANLFARIPVVTTYHGSDINYGGALFFSKFAIKLSAYNIFVSKKNVVRSRVKRNYCLLPCGVDLDNFNFVEKVHARSVLSWKNNLKYVIFAGAFDNHVKNYGLAKKSVELLNNDIRLVELKGLSREQVMILLCAADAFLMTSITEGSPQVIKEAMVCGCPVVSVDVGDVAEIIDGVDGCYMADRTPEDIANKLNFALAFNGRTKGREKIIDSGLTNDIVAKELCDIYQIVLDTKR